MDKTSPRPGNGKINKTEQRYNIAAKNDTTTHMCTRTKLATTGGCTKGPLRLVKAISAHATINYTNCVSNVAHTRRSRLAAAFKQNEGITRHRHSDAGSIRLPSPLQSAKV